MITGGSARFLLWDKPSSRPFFDIANRAPEGPVFDMGVDLDNYTGAVFVRADHVIEMARSLGMGTVEEMDALRAENESLRNQIKNLPDALEEFKSGIDRHISEFHTRLLTRNDSQLGILASVEKSAIPDWNSAPAK